MHPLKRPEPEKQVKAFQWWHRRSESWQMNPYIPQKKLQGSYLRSREAARSVVEDQQKAVELTTESFDRIGKQVEGLLGALSVINENVKSMEEGRNATLASISAISAISAQTAAGSANVAHSAERQLASVEQLDVAVEALEEKANELNRILQEFVV